MSQELVGITVTLPKLAYSTPLREDRVCTAKLHTCQHVSVAAEDRMKLLIPAGELRASAGCQVCHSGRSIPLVFRFGTAPTGIDSTTFIVRLSTTAVRSLPATAT